MITNADVIQLECQFRLAANAAIRAANPRFGPFVDVVAHPLNMIALLDEFRRLAALAESGAAVNAELNAWREYMSKAVEHHRDVIGRAMKAMKDLHEAAQPDEDSADINAVIPGARFAEFVDAHAALLYDIKHGPFTGDLTTPSANQGAQT